MVIQLMIKVNVIIYLSSMHGEGEREREGGRDRVPSGLDSWLLAGWSIIFSSGSLSAVFIPESTSHQPPCCPHVHPHCRCRGGVETTLLIQQSQS